MIKKILLLILFLCSPVLGQWQNGLKPMMGQQIDRSNPLSTGLVGYWLMNEGGGNIVQDLSGNGRKGTFGAGAAAPSWVSGKFGSAISFDGGDNINITGFTSDSVDHTFVFWLSSTLDSTTKYLFDASGDRFIIAWHISGQTAFGFYDGNWKAYSADKPPNDGLWHNIILTFDSSNSKAIYYLDGIYNNETTYTNSTLFGTVKLFSLFNDTSHWSGQASSVSYYNRALSAGEVADLYRNPFGIIQPTFPVWWYSGIGGEPPATAGQVIMISN